MLTARSSAATKRPSSRWSTFGVFLFIMTGVVYETQRWRNPEIANYVDALYFTVSTLTTTGFGDITLEGSLGRLIAVLIMIFGVTLSSDCSRHFSAHKKCGSAVRPARSNATT